MIKNNQSLFNGDLKYNKNNFEIKVSNGIKENNKINYDNVEKQKVNYLF